MSVNLLGNREPRLRKAIIGAWTLVSYVELDVATGAESHPWGEHPIGFLLYTADGYMSAQMQHPQRRQFADGDLLRATPEEYAAAGSSYVGYSGRFFVDEARRSLHHEMAVSFFPNWMGQKQIRLVEVDGERIRLRPEEPLRLHGELKTVSLTWQRAQPN